MPSNVPSHTHEWYPVSYDEAGKPRVWACGFTLRCIKTLTHAERYTKTGKERKVVDMVGKPRWAQ